jgi:selenocysteine lyase/cysteine desulfurase
MCRRARAATRSALSARLADTLPLPQLGAGYPASDAADAAVAAARRVAAALFAEDPAAGFPVLGHSASALLDMLARAVERTLRPGDVLVVSSAGHEANIGPWVRAAARAGAQLAWWHPAGANGEETCPLSDLQRLLGGIPAGRARVVAFPHASNLLGGVSDAARVAALARAAGALTVCDGVAFAPHRAVDAPALGLDFYVLSLYKTYGPHMGALYGTHAAWAPLRAHAPNHCFIAADAGAPPWYAWELGGVCHEACAALAGLRPYLRALAGAGEAAEGDEAAERACVRAAFRALPALEAPVLAALSSYFDDAHAQGRLRLIGPRGEAYRVPTFSFVPTAPGVRPADVVAACHAARVAVRHGHMYAPRLLRRLHVPADAALPPGEDAAEQAAADGDANGIAAAQPTKLAAATTAAPRSAAAALLGAGGYGAAAGGVVRVSAVHYNTLREAERCIAAIDGALGC